MVVIFRLFAIWKRAYLFCIATEYRIRTVGRTAIVIVIHSKDI